jgi:type VI secretion system protein ImpK
MQKLNDDLDSTLLFRPAAAAMAAAAQPATSVDIRQIGAMGAINPLVSCANPVLMMVPSLRTASQPSDVGALRARLVEMVKDFDAAMLKQGVSDEQRNIARYALCTVVDETIQMTPWGASANWAQQSLLIHFFKENWGGEKFFQILDKMSESPSRFVELLELFYICLALGFMGRFHLSDAAGRQAVVELRDRLYVLVRRGRAESERALSGHWQGLAIETRRFKGFGLFGLAAAAAAFFGLCVFAFYTYTLNDGLAQLGLDQLAIKKTELSKVAMAPASKPRLAQLLAPEIAAKQVLVRDLKLESVVTLLGESVFESGSAVPTARAVELMKSVASALDQIEGQVLVTGHTDNVPTRTLRYASNFVLSAERATNVKNLLAAQLRESTRISAEGKGDTEPLVTNTDAESRAQNRRVEISLRVPSTFQ